MLPRTVVSSAFTVLALVASSSAQLAPVDANPIAWRTAAPDAATLARTPAAVAAELDRALAVGDGAHVVVRLERAPRTLLSARLANAGIALGEALGDGAWFASVDAARADAARLAAVDGFLGLAAMRREWKLDPRLAFDEIPVWARIDAAPDPTLAVYALLHDDVDVADVGGALGAIDARVMALIESVNGLVLELPESRLDALAALDAVQWIEPPLPRLRAVKNDSNRVLTAADVVQAAPFGLDGSGVTVMVYDGGSARSTHVDFGGRLTVRDLSGTINHATHVSATIGGDGTATGGTFAGMAPGVTIESYGFEYDGTSIFLYTNPGDIEADYDEALNAFGATITNNSIGTNTEINGFPCNIQGDYGVTSALIDAIVGGSLGSPLRVVWANGNERQGSFCDLEGFVDYYSTAPPATAKNHITVGALNSNDDSMTSFSSWGPTDDGRLKPDVSAPGCQGDGDFGVTSAGSSSDTATSVLCGTSMASPTVCGIGALMIEDWRAQFGAPDPSNARLKVLLAQSAVDLGNPGPDYQFGYGSVRADAAVLLQRAGNHREAVVVDQGASVVYTVSVPAGAPELALTLAWDDVPGVPNVTGVLVNDLDLRVFDPGGVQHFPWSLDPADPGAAATRVARNGVDNIEQVRVDAAASGDWRVEVHGYDVPAGPQTFALVSSHALAEDSYVDIGFASAVPVAVEPDVATTITARVVPVGEALVGSPTLEYRFDGGAFSAVAMAPIGGDLYEATLPGAACGSTPELFVRATGTLSGEATNPADAPADLVEIAVEQVAVVFADDFELDFGWTVFNDVSLSDGPWERGVPAGDGGRNDPAVDFDGSGACWLTDNLVGNSDVDGGPTQLVSPVIDLSGTTGEVLVRYAAWLGNDDFDGDDLVVEVSDDAGGSWTVAETLANTGGWSPRAWRLLDFVDATATVQFRFSVADEPNDSVTEAALDAFEIVDVTCGGGKPSAGTSYGSGTAGSLGVPTILASGDLTVGSSLCLTGGNMPAGTSAFVAISGAAEIPALFGNNGIVLNVDAPFAGLLSFVANGDGEVVIDTTVPASASGISVFFQLFAEDGVGGVDFASSRGLELMLP